LTPARSFRDEWTLEQVTSELEREFHAEAHHALRVLAAAIDSFINSTTTTPEIEVEFENLYQVAQQETWSAGFGETQAKIVADLAALRKRVAETGAAADQIMSLVWS